MASTIRVVGIFTNGARSSTTAEERQARFNNDLTLANAAWGTGFAPGVSCGLRFASLRIFYHPDVTIDASTVSNVNDPRVANLITQARNTLNDATAISSDPIINSAQCSVAKQSKVIAQNAASSYLRNKKLGSARKKNNRPMVKKLNNTLTAIMRRMKPDVSRRRRTAKAISKARKPCCRPAANRRRTLKKK
ncbi:MULTISPECIES: hypothetical protein [unclassified Paenibacillus]|uniref:hypothetical protein n=1 Tax=unclassified Paenibacillus TaxID=185978 RepID=UPI0011A97C4E|nr:hypothetical protein [Paenibacillus sp. Y412MC10]